MRKEDTTLHLVIIAPRQESLMLFLGGDGGRFLPILWLGRHFFQMPPRDLPEVHQQRRVPACAELQVLQHNTLYKEFIHKQRCKCYGYEKGKEYPKHLFQDIVMPFIS